MNDMKSEFFRQLDELANVNHCGAGTVYLELNQRELRCRIASTDRLACEVDSIHVATKELETMDMALLETLSNRLADRLGYLEEALVVVEQDAERVESQLRSEKPTTADSGSRSYYEALVNRKGIAIQRYQKESNVARRLVPMVLTKPLLHRLCKDLVETPFD